MILLGKRQYLSGNRYTHRGVVFGDHHTVAGQIFIQFVRCIIKCVVCTDLFIDNYGRRRIFCDQFDALGECDGLLVFRIPGTGPDNLDAFCLPLNRVIEISGTQPERFHSAGSLIIAILGRPGQKIIG